MITIYTDGAVKGNQHKSNTGSYGFIALREDVELHQQARVQFDTTNNIMELRACIAALQWAEAKGEPVTIFTDSQYVCNGITEWIYGWIRKGWKSSTGKPVANKELWQELYALTQAINTSWKWIRGHNGDKHNSRVDELCNYVIGK